MDKRGDRIDHLGNSENRGTYLLCISQPRLFRGALYIRKVLDAKDISNKGYLKICQ